MKLDVRVFGFDATLWLEVPAAEIDQRFATSRRMALRRRRAMTEDEHAHEIAAELHQEAFTRAIREHGLRPCSQPRAEGVLPRPRRDYRLRLELSIEPDLRNTPLHVRELPLPGVDPALEEPVRTAVLRRGAMEALALASPLELPDDRVRRTVDELLESPVAADLPVAELQRRARMVLHTRLLAPEIARREGLPVDGLPAERVIECVLDWIVEQGGGG